MTNIKNGQLTPGFMADAQDHVEQLCDGTNVCPEFPKTESLTFLGRQQQ